MNALHLEVLTQCLFEYGKIPTDGETQRPDIPEDDWLNVIERVEQEIKLYCNIRSVPKALKYTWASMCVDYMRYWLAVSNNDAGNQSENPDDAVANMVQESIKVGDADVKLANRSLAVTDTGGRARVAALGSHQPDLDDIIFNYRAQLNKFRRMVWGSRRY